jgi:hypothetical protein
MGAARAEDERAKKCILLFTLGRGVYKSGKKSLQGGEKGVKE